MADTSLIFNIIARDSGVGRALSGVSGMFRSTGAAAEEALEKASSGTRNLDRQIEEAKARVRQLSQEFEQTGDKTLFARISKDRSLLAQLTKIRDGLKQVDDQAGRAGDGAGRAGSIFSRAAGGVANFGSSLVSAGSSAVGMLGSVSGLVAVGAGLSVFAAVGAPSLYAFGGAAAAIPGMLSGAIAAIATLKMGMSGLGENWDAMNAPATGGGGGGGGSAPAIDMTPKIRAVEAAQRDVARSARDLADAQSELREAQAGVSVAYDTARERLSDLNREVRMARVDQASAARDLTEAEQQLALARGRGNPEEIAKAQEAVERQRLALEEAADKADDLGKEYGDASRKGIDGSDEVVEARKRESDAQRRVQDAAEAHRLSIQRLGDAQADLKRKIDGASSSGGGLGGRVLPRIASSAREFLEELRRLKPAFDDLRLDIQQRLFEGLAGKLRILAGRWLPELHIGLGRMADMLNSVVKTAFDSLSEPEFIDNMMAGLSSFTDMLGEIGHAVAGPLVDAWGRLTRASDPILDIIGEKVSGIIIRFSDWIARMDDSGALDRFMEKAAHGLGVVFDIGEDLIRIGGSLISIFFGSAAGDTTGWDGLANSIDRVADYLGDPAVQDSMSRWVNFFGGAIIHIGNFLAWMDQIPGRIQTAGNWFKALPERVGNFLSRLPGIAGRWFSGMVSTMGYWIGYGIGWVIRQIASLPRNTLRILASLPGVFRNIGIWLSNATSDLPSRMWNVGANIVRGIWNGIAALSSWLWQQTFNFAANIWRGVQSALGIGSPSKVMADKVGQWIPEGIAVGMDGNRGVITRAVGRIQDALSAARLKAPTVGMEEAMATASGTLTVAARRQRVESVVVLDVRGQESTIKKMIRNMARTENLYQGGTA